LIEESSFRAPFYLRNRHVQTILPALYRKLPHLSYSRERINTPDDDFLDLDWSRVGSDRLVILLHGLEGDSAGNYILGMALALNNAGWDTVSMNYRGCSGEPNRQLRFYHSGASNDLGVVIKHVLTGKQYKTIALVGFSLGGNILLKYLGEQGKDVDPAIAAAVAFSVPCDLEEASLHFERWSNKVYLNRFLVSLENKIRQKHAMHPGQIDISGIEKIKTFQQFDDRYTAPLHGFRDAHDYYTQCSSIFYIYEISIPTLLVNAANDPFLPTACYPVKQAKENRNLYLEIPSSGGHVGFMDKGLGSSFWSDERAVAFLGQHS
jgi:hypothetical protein